MPYARAGLGDAFSDEAAAYAGLTPAQLTTIDGGQYIDVGNFAVDTGLAASLNDWLAFNGAYTDAPFGGQPFVQAIQTQPGLTALLALYQQMSGNNPHDPMSVPPQMILDNLTHAAGYTILQTGHELPASLSAAASAPYVAWLQALYPQLAAIFGYVNSDVHQDAIAAGAALDAARAAAAAGGTFTTPYGNQIPLSLISEGPVTLPDGWVYLVVHDVPGGNPDYVSWWPGPSVTTNPLNAFVEPGQCDSQPGTGMWYALGSLGATCPAPPIGWVPDGFVQISARAKQSLMLSSTNLAPASTGGTPTMASTQPIVIQDENGNPIAGETIDYTGTAPILIGTLPVTTTLPVNTSTPSALPSSKALLIAGAVVALAFMLPRSRR